MNVELDLTDYYDGCKFPSEVRPPKAVTELLEVNETTKIRVWWSYWQYKQYDEWYYESVIVNTETGSNWYCYENGRWYEYFNGYYRHRGPGSCVISPALRTEFCADSYISFAPPSSLVDNAGYLWSASVSRLPDGWTVSTIGGPAHRSHEASVILPPNMGWPETPGVYEPNPHCSEKKIGLVGGDYVPWWTYVDPDVGFLPHPQPMHVYWMPVGCAVYVVKYTKGSKYCPPPFVDIVSTLLLGLSMGATLLTRRQRS